MNWDELSKDYELEGTFKTWGALSKDAIDDNVFVTYDNMGDASGAVSSYINDFLAPDGPVRMEAKLQQSLRFRRLYFELYLDCDGTAATSPVQVFSIIPMVGAKAKVSKEAN